MALEAFIRNIPKTEIHIHLEGAINPETFLKLSRKNKLEIPDHKNVSEIYQYDNLLDFLKVYNMASRSVIDADDFHLITYEMLQACANSGARYVEFFFSPHVHLECDVAYQTMLAGMFRAMDDIETDFGLISRLIPAHNRELGLERGFEFLDMVLAHRTDKVIGIGLDFDETPFPPAQFKPLFDRARQAGLHRTAHAGEGGPASNVRDSLDLLKVERIDHGYRVMEDLDLVARCRADRTVFTICPSSTVGVTIWRDLAAKDHPIRQMIEAGLTIVVAADDPPMFETDLANEYQMLATNMNLDAAALKTLALNSLEASWLDESVKRDWRASWSREIDEQIALLDAENSDALTSA
ncbi:Adenine deaminase [Aminobacter sp. MSH1]|uniref:adenosine deaminase n=1 Tax=Aminobacter sp. MSH1 TaxID=374606 RepID=UPI000D3491E8|nr:adenosine deaminase [Aminobacter sp. MSH1]AWC24522.1 Adenine deaminase [Aminobacter sp. MSH1]